MCVCLCTHTHTHTHTHTLATQKIKKWFHCTVAAFAEVDHDTPWKLWEQSPVNTRIPASGAHSRKGRAKGSEIRPAVGVMLGRMVAIIWVMHPMKRSGPACAVSSVGGSTIIMW
jgi:hypothetical protein